jgi:hypothetical protein
LKKKKSDEHIDIVQRSEQDLDTIELLPVAAPEPAAEPAPESNGETKTELGYLPDALCCHGKVPPSLFFFFLCISFFADLVPLVYP